MIQVYKHNNGHLEDNISLASAEKGSWIHVVNPDSEDLQLVSMVTREFDTCKRKKVPRSQ